MHLIPFYYFPFFKLLMNLVDIELGICSGVVTLCMQLLFYNVELCSFLEFDGVLWALVDYDFY